MTIEEAKDIIERDLYTSEIIEDDLMFNALHAYYEAKEEELEGALIIPKGVKLVNIIQSQEGEYKTFVADYYSIIEGVGTHPHKALRNALEQIKTK